MFFKKKDTPMDPNLLDELANARACSGYPDYQRPQIFAYFDLSLVLTTATLILIFASILK
jgi:hypothetical protein